MRIWDINPGYLNRQSLLGEHRELHAIVSIITGEKKGYSNHPETCRWKKYGWALTRRHKLLASEMTLRGYKEKSPVTGIDNENLWPSTYIDPPHRQFVLLAEKYKHKEQGRIPLPKSAQELWSHHKYSIMARNINLYKGIGRQVATIPPSEDFSSLSDLLTGQLRIRPSSGGLRNALLHMWGHVARHEQSSGNEMKQWSLMRLMDEVQQRTIAVKEPYLFNSTALSELRIWI